jgi:hypothetical protein
MPLIGRHHAAERIFSDIDAPWSKGGRDGVLAVELEHLKGIEKLWCKLFGSKIAVDGKVYIVTVSGRSYKSFINRVAKSHPEIAKIKSTGEQLQALAALNQIERKKIIKQKKMDAIELGMNREGLQEVKMTHSEFNFILAQFGITGKQKEFNELFSKTNLSMDKKGYFIDPNQFAAVFMKCMEGEKVPKDGSLHNFYLAAKKTSRS